MIVEFPEWLPDLPDINNPGTTVATNVTPAGDSYQPFNAFSVDVSTSLTAYVRGGILVRDITTGQSSNFVGTETDLYQGSSSGWTNVSVAGGYALGTDELWFFTQFNDDIIAVNIDTPIQTFDLDASSLFSTLVATIKARYVATVKDFVMVANTYDTTDGTRPNRVRWCAINDPTDWTVSAVTQSDYQDLDAQWGWITGLVGGDHATVFQERAITTLDYVGTPLIFQVRGIEQNQGCIYPKSIIQVGTLIYYLGIDGFYVFDGNRSVSIGANKVDQYFFDTFDQAYPYRISTAVDYQKQVIYWLYPASGNNGGTPNQMLIYNYSPNSTKRWSVVTFTVNNNTLSEDTTVSFLMNAYSYGYTLEELDVPFSNNLDLANMPSLDSRVWTGQNLVVGGFNRFNQFGTFEGSPMTATITTAEFEMNDAARTELHRFKPIIDGSVTTITCRVGYRLNTTDNLTYSSNISLNSFNEAVSRINSRYFRIEVTIAGGSWDAVGFQILEARKVGAR